MPKIYRFLLATLHRHVMCKFVLDLSFFNTYFMLHTADEFTSDFQIFMIAKVPVQPFVLIFIIPFDVNSNRSIMNQTIQNPISREEFSVYQDKPRYYRDVYGDYGEVFITIKRSRKTIAKLNSENN